MKKSRKRIKKPKKTRRKAAKRPLKKPRKKQLRKKSRRRRVVKKVVRRVKKARRKSRARVRKSRLVKKSKVGRKYSKGSSLEQLFEAPAKVQVMKLFFRNPETSFLLKEAARSMRMNLSVARKQMKKLEKIGFLKTRRIFSHKQTFFINPNLDFFNELKELILKSKPVSKEKILKAIRGLGRIKLVLLSGLLVGNEMSRADLLIVGDSINSRRLNTFIKNLEAEAGTDIRCVAMTTEEFNYRYDMYDRFIRDLLSEKGEFLINKLGL